MKTKALLRTAILFATAFLLTSCIFDSLMKPEDNSSTTQEEIIVTILMPDSAPQTRISLESDGLDINLAWQDGDQLDLLVAYDEKQEKQTVTVTVDQHNNKKASFPLTLPTDINETFDLYGVYGGGGLSDTPNEHLLKLPTPDESVSGTLDGGIQVNKTLVLMFKEKNINKATPAITANFEHLGSLFRIFLKNTGTTAINNITEAQLIAYSDISAHRSSLTATYDITADANPFVGTTTAGTTLSFNRSSADLPANGTLEFWGWYIPTGDLWPALALRIMADGGTDGGYFRSLNAKPQRPTAPEVGKVYHFYAEFNESLFVTTQDWTAKDPWFIDFRDGNVYKTATIGTQTWMAENLKFLTSVTAVSGAGPYVYDYAGTDVAAAKETDNYKTYGVLYNWATARDGSASSTAEPSGVQGICPSGWHLPSTTEWGTLEAFLGGVATAGGEMKETGTAHWNDPNTGATNSSGFTALPGSYRTDKGAFGTIGTEGYWQTATEKNAQFSYYRKIINSSAEISADDGKKDSAFSVRCVRD